MHYAILKGEYAMIWMVGFWFDHISARAAKTDGPKESSETNILI